ncbi:MAG: hypothetical protein AAGG75_20130 [Bacteroidota bacterium]
MKKSILLLFVLVFSFQLLAQDNSTIKIVHLNDGSKLKGVVVSEDKEAGNIDFQILKGPRVVIDESSIVEIEDTGKGGHISWEVEENPNFIQSEQVNRLPQGIQDVTILFLKDGSKLKGIVLDRRTSEGTVEFQILGGPVVVIAQEEIEEEVQASEIEEERGVVYFENGKSIRTQGYYGILQFNTNWTNTESVDGNFGGMGIATIHGYQFHRFLSVGGGTGIDVFNGPRFESYAFLPVFLDLRSFPLNQKVGLYGAVKLGYGLSFSEIGSDESPFRKTRYTNGWMGEAAIGLRFASHKRGRFFTELGYRIQETTATFQERDFFDNSTFFEDDITFIRFSISFGWIF